MQENTNVQILNDTIQAQSSQKDSLVVGSSPSRGVSIQESNSDTLESQTTQALLTENKVIKDVEAAKVKVERGIKKPVKAIIKTDSVVEIKEKPQAKTYLFFNNTDQRVESKHHAIWSKQHIAKTTHEFPLAIKQEFQRSQLNWTLVVGCICMALLLILKVYYQKFVTKVLNTTVNFQLADNMFREKNIIVRRAFFMMNVIYVLVFSLFVMLFASLFEFLSSGNLFYDYLIILGGFIAILIIRLLSYYITAYMFEWKSAIAQQIHISFLVNKNLGIILLPLVFSAIYSTPIMSKFVLFLGLGIIFFATLYKIIRGFQIIMRNGVLLFYAIVYLCTLELLPLVVGTKIITLLR